MPHVFRVALNCLAPIALAGIAAAQTVFTVFGPGAPIPAAGTGGGGSWPLTLPPSPGLSYLNSAQPVPAEACRFTRITIYGLTHTWIGDMHIVLGSPTGRMYTLVHRPGFTGMNDGNDGDVSNANITLVATDQAQYPPPPSLGNWSAGTYVVSFGTGGGTWPNGINSIYNRDLDEIGTESGIWSLRVFDWANGDVGSFSSWEIEGVCGFPAQYSGPGTYIPASGTGGGGAWPGTLPPSPAIVSTIYTPTGFLKVKRVVIESLVHTWVGDLQIALRPQSSYRAVNLAHRPGFTGTGSGNSGNCTGGDYTFVSPADFSGGTPPSSGDWLPGTYKQFYGSGGGTWPSGPGGIDNDSLESLQGIEGSWQLEIYDWAGGDVGSFASWRVEGYFLPTGPTAYCTAGTSSNGCTPMLTASGTPSASMMWPFSVSASGIEGQKSGMIFYGIQGKNAVPWGASFLCVLSPIQRTPVQNSGGAAGSCQGLFALDWSAFRIANPAAIGQPFTSGECAFFQGWYRDPGATPSTNFTNAMVVTHLP